MFMYLRSGKRRSRFQSKSVFSRPQPPTSGAAASWFFQAGFGREFQHPHIRLLHPTLGASLTLVGESVNQQTGATIPKSLVGSVLGGFRIGTPRRPGMGSGWQLTLQGGPALILNGSDLSIGATAGVAGGYRWRWAEISFGASHTLNPSRSADDLGGLTTIGGAFNMALF